MIKSLIVGVDPGTTLGYAVLDFNGDVVKVGSSKELNLDYLVAELLNHGSVKIVSTDKKKVPSFVNKLSARFGAKIVKPKKDLKVDFKRSLVSIKLNNDHERDALSIALYAFKQFKNLFRRIDVFLEKKNIENMSDYFKSRVVKDEKSMNDIYNELFKKEE